MSARVALTLAHAVTNTAGSPAKKHRSNRVRRGTGGIHYHKSRWSGIEEGGRSNFKYLSIIRPGKPGLGVMSLL